MYIDQKQEKLINNILQSKQILINNQTHSLNNRNPGLVRANSNYGMKYQEAKRKRSGENSDKSSIDHYH